VTTNGISLKIDKKWLWLVAMCRIMVFFLTPADTQEEIAQQQRCSIDTKRKRTAEEHCSIFHLPCGI
jgi:hypothetical protein